MKLALPDDVKEIIEKLNKNGFEAFAVGGCVRDSILGNTPNDWDICTNAKPLEIKSCFADYNMFDAGMKHGTISVVVNHIVYEITTYRIDGEYKDNRHPENVTFTDDITNDLARRDFTINAMAYNEQQGLIDPFGGQSDLEKGIIKCVGNPDKRFNEDGLRIIRALRFAAVYNLKIEKETAKSILKNADLLNNITVERISTEFNKLLCGSSVEYILNEYRDVIAVFIPEIIPTFDFCQHNKHHSRDIWHHATYSVKSVENTLLLRMTMLLHDLGKPKACTRDTDGTCHFKGHQIISAELANKILHRLKYPTEFIEKCLVLIRYHDVRFNGTKRHIKRIMSKIGEENMKYLLKVQKADMLAQSEYMRKEKTENINLSFKLLNEIIADNECFSLRQLEINGKDLIDAGIPQGKQLGEILNLLLENVIDGQIENTRSILLNKAKKLAGM